MVRFKMLGQDVEASLTQYRTWVVEGQPDPTGQLYTGPKGGTNPLIDIVAHPVNDESLVVDFNLPNPTSWSKTYRTLPERIYDSQLAVVGEYIYLFGGNTTDKIFRAPIGRPADWKYTGAKLPTPLYGSQIAIVDDRIYLFGGNNGVATDTIYSASVSDPLTWTNHGSLLPRHLYHSQLCMADGYLYLLGGQETNYPTNVILVSTIGDPLTWTEYPYTLPDHLYGSHIGILDGYAYLFGGIVQDVPVSNIYKAKLGEFNAWTLAGNLPQAVAFGQFATIGGSGYLFSVDKERLTIYTDSWRYNDIPIPGTQTYNTKIFKCDILSPLNWEVQSQVIPGEFLQSQFAIINDRLLLLGGNGLTAIFADNPIIHYPFYLSAAIDYGYYTRTVYCSAPDRTDLMKILGFPYWKTDYYSCAPLYFLFAKFTSSSAQSSLINVKDMEKYRVNWGDGNIEVYDGYGTLDTVTHSYSVAITHEQRWYVANDKNNVREFVCSYNNLTGNIILPQYCLSLNHFDCSNNSLTGNLDSVATNTALTNFDCSYNLFSGSIPSLNNNTQLQYFACSSNQLTGSIPDLSTNIALVNFKCDLNQLIGSIPSLDNNTYLSVFYCQQNELTGSIPSLNNNTSLMEFNCHTNELTGSIPTINVNALLEDFRCHKNQLTGSIPSLNNNINLRYFSCNDNELTGSLPLLNSNLLLEYFIASNNQLTGSIPILSNNTSLVYFDVSGNSLSSYTASSIALPCIYFGAASNLLLQSDVDQIISDFLNNLSSRPVSGTILLNGTGNAGPSLTGRTNKQTIIDYGWTVLTNLNEYILGFVTDNSLGLSHEFKFNVESGMTFSIDWGDGYIQTESGQGTDYISPQIINYTYGSAGTYAQNIVLEYAEDLKYLNCQNNSLIGSLPSISDLINLYAWECDNNSFTGGIPDLSSNTLLEIFTCSNNQLTGYIPDTSSNVLLTTFDCGVNQLSGIIPSLSSNTVLETFACNDNNISGYTASSLPLTLVDFRAENNALVYNNVDQILSDFATNLTSRPVSGIVDLSGTGNEPVSPFGYSDKDNIIAHGWTVNTNVGVTVGPFTAATTTQTFFINADSGSKYFTVWGDGGIDAFVGTGSYQNNTHSYSSSPNDFNIVFFDPTQVNQIQLTGDFYDSYYLSGNIPDLSAFTNVQMIQIDQNSLTGSIPSISSNTLMTWFNCAQNELTGSIPSLDFNLVLETFYCQNNQLTGSMPSLSNNAALINISVSQNQLTGSIPSLNNNTNLTIFNCSYNELTGSIPSLSNNGALYSFTCNDNQLSGSIPSLSNNVALTSFECRNNLLTGSIPLLSNNILLSYFSCKNNLLTGSIPSISSNVNLGIFDCSINQLVGNIPVLLSNSNLTQFWCYSNQLTGSIPPLDNNIDLIYFSCAENELSGSIPSLTNNVNLQLFNCGDNNITGYVPSTLALSLTDFRANNNLLPEASVDQILSDFNDNLYSRPTYGYIDLSGSGNSPPSVTGETYKTAIETYGWTVNVNSGILYMTFINISTPVEHIELNVDTGTRWNIDWGDGNVSNLIGNGSSQYVSHTYSPTGTHTIRVRIDDLSTINSINAGYDLYGNLPEFSLAAPGLQWVEFSYNNITGNIPAIGSGMTACYLQYMQLDGYIESMNAATDLQEMYCNNNNLTDSIPSLAACSSMYTFDCSNNQLTGSIPDLNPYIYNFYASVNQLTGSIPTYDASYTNLYTYYVNNNQLTGSLPNITATTYLRYFDCSNNQLTGSISGFSAANTNLRSYSCGNNLLTGSFPSLSVVPNINLFYCNNNLLTGSIPSLASNTNLEYFNCSYNQLTGAFPTVSSHMFRYFICSNNQLTGTISIPGSIVYELDCSDNQLTGFNYATTTFQPYYCTKIDCHNNLLTQTAVDDILHAVHNNLINRPTSLVVNLGGTGNAGPSPTGEAYKAAIIAHGCTVITNVGTIAFSSSFNLRYQLLQTYIVNFDAGTAYNINWGDGYSDSYIATGSDETRSHLYGSFGGFTCNITSADITKLRRFIARDNYYSNGSIPALAGASALIEFDCRRGLYVYGTVPDLSTCTNLQTFRFAQCNYIGGSLPSLAACTSLVTFDGYQNSLTGSIPALPPSIQYFDVHNNYGMNGTIPSLSTNTALQYFYAYGNTLTGTIPSLTNNTALKEFLLDASGAAFTGTIPSLTTNTALERFQVGGNSLTGSIPSLATNTALRTIVIFGNSLTGSIPSLTNNTQLTMAQFSGNSLTGSIPSVSTNTLLKAFYITGSSITGSIPSLNNNAALMECSIYCTSVTGTLPTFGSSYSNAVKPADVTYAYFRCSYCAVTGWGGGSYPTHLHALFAEYCPTLGTAGCDSILQAAIDSGLDGWDEDWSYGRSIYLNGSGTPTYALKSTLLSRGWSIYSA